MKTLHPMFRERLESLFNEAAEKVGKQDFPTMEELERVRALQEVYDIFTAMHPDGMPDRPETIENSRFTDFYENN